MTLEATLRLDHELVAIEGERTVHCLLELQAPAAPAATRLPLHLMLVLDRSGSMAGPKLEAAKACAALLARRLAPTDQLGVVTFDDRVALNFPLQPVGSAQLALEQALGTITHGGSTNLSGGWLKGIEQLHGTPGGHGPKRVLLLTDGQANQGVTEHGALVAMARAASDDGAATTTIGFGDGFDEDLLTRMADGGGGNAYYAASAEEAPGIFAQEFEGLMTLVAQNISVEVRPGQDVEWLGVLNDAPVVTVPGGMQVQLGDAYADERRRVLFELQIPRLAELGVRQVAEVLVRHVSLGDRIAAHELTLPVTVNAVTADEAVAAGTDPEVTEEVVVLKSARAQEEARKRAFEGDPAGASELLRGVADELRKSAPGSRRPAELLVQAEEMESYGRRLTEGPMDPTLSKEMRFSSRNIQRGRKQK
jgi:Ca-activated chloride channel family protein